MVSRIFIGNELFQFSTEDGLITQVNAHANTISVKDLQVVDGGANDNNYLLGYINETTGEILTSIYFDKDYKDRLEQDLRSYKSISEELSLHNHSLFILPEELCHHGYPEFSDFAKIINTIYPEEYNFRVLDDETAALLLAQKTERDLPILDLEGTDFCVDVTNLQLLQKDNPANTISLFDMRDVENGYIFEYNPLLQNIPSNVLDYHNAETVRIPQLVELDPIGMAEKYGYLANDIRGKSDFQVMVDQDTVEKRLKGQLPSIAIAGHTFYVDIRMGMLRPKNDFNSKGIVFSEIDHCFVDDQERYLIPYNPRKHEFVDLDYDTITEIPKDVIFISFPHETKLDPIGWNREGGWNETDGLKKNGIQSHFESTIIDWKDVGIHETITVNKKNQGKEGEQLKDEVKTLPKNARKSRRPKF